MKRYRMAFCTLDDVVLQLNYDKAATLQLNSGQQALVDNLVTNPKELFKKLIYDASDDIMNKWYRFFVPSLQTVTTYASDSIWGNSWRYHNGAYIFTTLNLDYADLLSINSVSLNGVVIDSSYYRLYPSNVNPAYGISFNPLGINTPSSSDFDTNLSITALWGYHENPSSMWNSIGTLQSSLSDSATSFVATAGTVTSYQVYQYLRIGDEFLFVTDVVSDSPYTITVERGVNGTTAAAHNSSDSIDAYQIMPQVAQATRRQVIRLFRKSPEYSDMAIVGETTVNVDPETIKLSVPKREQIGGF